MSSCCHCHQPCGQPHITCDSCNMAIHAKCLDLSDSELRVITISKSTHLKILCNQCKTTLNSLNEMKTMISTLQNTIFARLDNVESLLHGASLIPSAREEIIQESVERSLRASNIILYNVPENPDVGDDIIANDILEQIHETAVVQPEDVTRVGKPTSKKPRPLKLHFNRVELARSVLRNSSALKNSQFNNIRVNSDKTPQQQEYYRQIKNELESRKNNGETNLSIKYKNNIPEIIQRAYARNTNPTNSLNLNRPTVSNH